MTITVFYDNFPFKVPKSINFLTFGKIIIISIINYLLLYINLK